MVHGGVVGSLEVDPERDRHVRVARRRGDDHLPGPALQVDRGVGAVGEAARGLDHHVHAQLLPRQLRGVGLGEHLQLVAVHLDRPIERPHIAARVGAVDRVVLQQVRERTRVGEVVDGDPLDGVSIRARARRAQHIAADAAKSVDSDTYGHFSFGASSGAHH